MKISNLLPMAAVLLASLSLSAEQEIDYHTEIAPLLRDYCGGCHNEGDYEGGFSIETFAALMEGGESEGKTMIVPGKPDESYLMQTISKIAKPAMPPKKEPQPSADEIALVSRWIADGAKGPPADQDMSILSTLTVPKIAPSGHAARAITGAAFSPDGKWEAIARFGGIEVRESGSEGAPKVFALKGGKINAVHFSSDSAKLIAASGISGLRGEATIWDVKSGAVIRSIGKEKHRDILFDAEFSPDGSLIATAGYDQIIHLWKLVSGELVRSFPSHTCPVFDLAFSPDGTVLASASGDGTCKIWQVATGERLDTLNQPEAEQFRVAFTPDSKSILAAGADNRIRLWQFQSKTAPKINPLVTARFGHEDAIVEMAVSRDGSRLATASTDLALKLWSLPDLRLLDVLEAQSDVVSVLAFSGNAESLFAARLDGSKRRYTIEATPDTGRSAQQPASREGSPVRADTRAEVGPVMLAEAEGGKNPTLVRRSELKGEIALPGDEDEFRFSAKRGERWIFEVNAARSKSKLDSRLAIFDSNHDAVEQVVLQAVRDSWLTFRGKDSKGVTDFRVHNWEEMELDEYLFVNGEVVKLWLYPRGPDSGFVVYPGFGERRTSFQTTAMAHPLGQPCYIVRAYPPESDPAANGLPIYRLNYENDDDPERRLGSDSRLNFTAPGDGEYIVRLSDVRGFGGEGYRYTLIARKPKPDFSVVMAGKDLKIAPGSSKELTFTASRADGFSGPIHLQVSGLPEGLSIPAIVTIEAGQDRAFALLQAGTDFAGLTKKDAAKVVAFARAKIDGKDVERKVESFGPVTVAPDKKLRARILADGKSGRVAEDGVLEFTIHPGETITARVAVERNGVEGDLKFGNEDSGRNLPHGVFVDNIGLSGLMIPNGKSDQKFFITASEVARETVRDFHLVTGVDGGHGTQTVRLRVVAPETMAGK